MANVSRSATGTGHGNLIIPFLIQVKFQVFPGVKGTDAQRGIPDIPYSFKSGNSAPVNGKTTADGGIILYGVIGEKVVLTIFETDYLINVLTTIEAPTTPKGRQRRLSLLGYELGGIDGSLAKKSDRAILNYQADSNLNADGTVDNITQTELVKDFGA
jgi:Putative peptidoglycan binding domain